MKKLLTALTASALLFTVAAIGPVDAKAPERGDQIMVLNEMPGTGQFGQFGCPEISWFGTIELAGTTYGMALYPLPGRITGNGNILHYEEGWKVWTGSFTLNDDLVSASASLVRSSCPVSTAEREASALGSSGRTARLMRPTIHSPTGSDAGSIKTASSARSNTSSCHSSVSTATSGSTETAYSSALPTRSTATPDRESR